MRSFTSEPPLASLGPAFRPPPPRCVCVALGSPPPFFFFCFFFPPPPAPRPRPRPRPRRVQLHALDRGLELVPPRLHGEHPVARVPTVPTTPVLRIRTLSPIVGASSAS